MKKTIGLTIMLVVATLFFANLMHTVPRESSQSSGSVGVIGVEPTLYPDMDDSSDWKKFRKSCSNNDGKSVELAGYIRTAGAGDTISVDVLSLSGVRVAYRAGFFDGTNLLEVMHVRSSVKNHWVKYDWRIQSEARASQLRTMDELGLTEKQFRNCFGGS